MKRNYEIRNDRYNSGGGWGVEKTFPTYFRSFFKITPTGFICNLQEFDNEYDNKPYSYSVYTY